MSIGIYKIENLINHKVYIGQSIHIERRWLEHCQQSAKSLIGEAIQKYGKENFSFQILKEVEDVSCLNSLESYYIQQYNSLAPNGYNIVLIDDQQHHQFNAYSHDTFLLIIEDIKNSSLTFKEIANKYELDLSMIYYLNRGDYHAIPNEIYPLRPVRDMSKKYNYCIDCGIEISKGASRCTECSAKKQRWVERPSREELKKLIRTTPFTTIGKTFGVNDNTIRKWCKAENLPYRVCDIKVYSKEEWKNV